MKVRKRAFPLTFEQRAAIADLKATDPRKGSKQTRGDHAPKMRPNSEPKPVLYPRSEWQL